MRLSLVVIAYNMGRELPRTLRSLSPAMQRGCDAQDYEVVVVDNGSPTPPELPYDLFAPDRLRAIRIDPAQASVSPVRAVQVGLEAARAELVGLMIDGARMASPGVVAGALHAAGLVPLPVILTLAFHLGPEVQMQSVHRGYDQAVEDRLLEESGWWEDGYRLFDISVLAGSSSGGWFKPIRESNAIVMPRALWTELGGCDPGFVSAGGGLANLDLLKRAVTTPGAGVVTLMGEGTFHQVHGGVATNARQSPAAAFMAEYVALRGEPYQAPEYTTLYYGRRRDAAFRPLCKAAAAGGGLGPG